MYLKRRLIDRGHGSNNLPADQCPELIRGLCRSFLPVARKIPAGLQEILNTEDTNDAIFLFRPLLVVMLRTLKHRIRIRRRDAARMINRHTSFASTGVLAVVLRFWQRVSGPSDASTAGSPRNPSPQSRSGRAGTPSPRQPKPSQRHACS